MRINFDKAERGSWDTKARRQNLITRAGAKEKNGCEGHRWFSDEIQERRSGIIRNPTAQTEKEGIREERRVLHESPHGAEREAGKE